MHLALAQLAFRSFDEQRIVEEEATITHVEVDYTPHPSANDAAPASEEVKYHTNLNDSVSIDEYQAIVQESAIPMVVAKSAINPNVDMANRLLVYRSAPYIARTSEDRLAQYGTGDAEAVSYIRVPTQQDPHFWCIFMINTDYGHIYLSTVLDDEGNIPDNTAGVFITFDSDATSSVLHGAVAEHPERFVNQQFTYGRVIENVSELEFLLGDREHEHTVARYM